jgi:hypothetical protein
MMRPRHGLEINLEFGVGIKLELLPSASLGTSSRGATAAGLGLRLRCGCCGKFLGAGCRAGDDNAVATITLGLVESIVGELDQEIALVCGFLEGRHANRNRQHTWSFASPVHVTRFELAANFLGADGGLMQGAFGQDEREFLSSVSAGQVVGADRPKQGISDKTDGGNWRVTPGSVILLCRCRITGKPLPPT